MACACREIIMGKQSSLGPIDPQIIGLPASGILSEFDNASKEIKHDKSKIHVWGPILSNYPPSLIEACKKAISWSQELASDYLSYSMFKDDLAKDSNSARKKLPTSCIF